MTLLLGFPFVLALAAVTPEAVMAAGEPVAGTASLHGTVLDTSRAPIEGARVDASRGGAAISSTRTDPRGEFTLALPAGEYTVRAGAAGFREAAALLTARPDRAAAHEFILEVAAFRDAVTVEAAPGYHVGAVVS